MSEDRNGSEKTYGTLVPISLWALGAKVPTIVATVGILWTADYPRGEWAFAAVLLFVSLAVIKSLVLLPVLLVGLLVLPVRRTLAKVGPKNVFRPDIDPDTSHLTMSEVVRARKQGAIMGTLSRRVVPWSVALFGVAYAAPLLGLPPLELSVGLFVVAALCLVLSPTLVALGTATLGFFLAESRTGGLWRQLLLTHLLQFGGMIDLPAMGEGRPTHEDDG